MAKKQRWRLVQTVLGLPAAVLFYSLGIGIMSAQTRLTIHQTPEHPKLLLRGYEDPLFSEQLNPMRSRRADPLLPYAVLIENGSDLAIVGYCVRWLGTDASGIHVEQFVEDADFGRFQALPAHSGRLLSVVRGLNAPGAEPPERRVQRFLDLYANQKRIDVSIDALIFEDGSTAGPNLSNFLTYTIGQIRAEGTVFKLVRSLRGSEALDAELSKFADEAVAMALRVMPPIQRAQSDLYRWARHAPNERDAEIAMRGFYALGLLNRIQQVGRDEMSSNVQQSLDRKQYPEFKGGK